MIKKTLKEFFEEYKPVKTTLIMFSDHFNLQSRYDIVFSKFRNDIFTLKFVNYDEEYDGYEIVLNFIEEGIK